MGAFRLPDRLRVSALSRLPGAFHALSGARKVDAILSLEDPAGFVQSLAADELYLLVTDIGIVDTMELIAMSTTAQRRSFIDIDAWRGDELAPEALDEWLDVFADASNDLVMDTVGGLDPELIVAYLLTHTHELLDRTQEDEVVQYQSAWDLVWTPDREFVLVLPGGLDQEITSRIRRMLELLYRRDYIEARALLFSARTGLRLEQEELAYRFRRGRLADLGFADREEAHALWAPIPLDALRAQLDSQVPPQIYAEGERLSHALVRVGSRPAFLNDCLAGLERPDRFVQDFALCFNRAVVASPEGIVLKNSKRLDDIARRLHATISLALEHLADGDPDRGASLLDRAWCTQLHQAGHALAVERARRARAIEQRAEGLLDTITAKVVAGLLMTPTPRRWDPATDAYHAFETRAHLTDTDAVLARAEALIGLFEDKLGFSLEAYRSHEFAGLAEDDRLFIDFDVLTRTLLAHVAAGGAPSFEPLSAAQLDALAAAVGSLGTTAASLAAQLGGGAATPAFETAALRLQEALVAPSDDPMTRRVLSTLVLIDRAAIEEEAP